MRPPEAAREVTMPEPVKVFFEPRIPEHAFEAVVEPVSPAFASSEDGLARFRADGFLLVRGLLEAALVTAGRRELEAMALADDPACAEIWYEGALRDRLPLDPARDRAMVCGSLAFNTDVKAVLEGWGLREGANSEPREYVVEKAFVGDGI